MRSDRPAVANGLADVGWPTRSDTGSEVREVLPQVLRIGRLQPELLTAVCPPNLEVSDGAFGGPLFCLFRQQQDVDEASDAQADVYEDPDRPRSGHLHDSAPQDLPEAQIPSNPLPLRIRNHTAHPRSPTALSQSDLVASAGSPQDRTDLANSVVGVPAGRSSARCHFRRRGAGGPNPLRVARAWPGGNTSASLWRGPSYARSNCAWSCVLRAGSRRSDAPGPARAVLPRSARAHSGGRPPSCPDGQAVRRALPRTSIAAPTRRPPRTPGREAVRHVPEKRGHADP